MKTRKVAMVSSRDMYIVLTHRMIPAESSPTGKKIMIIAGRTCELPQYPENAGIVRAATHITGYYIEELSQDEV